LNYGDALHLLHQMHHIELRGPTNRARLGGTRAGHAMIEAISFPTARRRKSLHFSRKTNKNEAGIETSSRCRNAAYYAIKCRRVENFSTKPFIHLNLNISKSLNGKTIYLSGKLKEQLPDFMDMSIFLISPYSIAASQDKAISQNVINTAASHKDITRISDLLHPQELLRLVLDKILDLCRL
ncbi:hypothetical protein X777_06353, partial [Ooceraea biroi]